MFLINNNDVILNEFTIENIFGNVKFNITDIRGPHCGRIKVLVPPYSKNANATSVPILFEDLPIDMLLMHNGVKTVKDTAKFLCFIAGFIVTYHDVLLHYADLVKNGNSHQPTQDHIKLLMHNFANEVGFSNNARIKAFANKAYMNRHK